MDIIFAKRQFSLAFLFFSQKIQAFIICVDFPFSLDDAAGLQQIALALALQAIARFRRPIVH